MSKIFDIITHYSYVIRLNLKKPFYTIYIMKRAVEPPRKSLLDVVRKNLRAIGRMTYTTRFAYIGEYVGSHTSIEERMENIIHNLQIDYTGVTISGLLLVYPQYYIHVLEAPEDVIYRHFTALYDSNCTDCEVKRAIFLPTFHHVHQRFFDTWFHMYTVPPSLIQKLESYELEDIQLHMTNCYNKIYMLCDHISKLIATTNVSTTLGDKLTSLYPESTLIEYLLHAKSPVLITVEEYLNMYRTVPLIKLYSDTIWPAPRDLIFSDGYEKHDRGSAKDKET